jgi:predicted transcriptional regulator
VATPNKRFSSEYTMLSILEYLFIHTRATPVSKYHISVKIPGIKLQRRDRISAMMDTLEKKRLVRSIHTTSTVFYQITDEGVEAYLKWVKPFLDFAREQEKGLS